MDDRAFSLSFFRYFRAFSHYELLVSFHSLNFGFKINRNTPLVIISSKLPALTNGKKRSTAGKHIVDHCDTTAFASKARVPNLSLTMYIFSISTDEHAPLKFLMP